MRVQCKRCSSTVFNIPEYTLEQKKHLFGLKSSGNSVLLMKEIKMLHKLRLIEVKFIMMHINEEYGKCNRCNFSNLNEEFINCPKCKALNFNWKV